MKVTGDILDMTKLMFSSLGGKFKETFFKEDYPFIRVCHTGGIKTFTYTTLNC